MASWQLVLGLFHLSLFRLCSSHDNRDFLPTLHRFVWFDWLNSFLHFRFSRHHCNEKITSLKPISDSRQDSPIHLPVLVDCNESQLVCVSQYLPNTSEMNHENNETVATTAVENGRSRKTWQTSPEQVEELTRSLSQMKTNPTSNGYSYEKLVERSTKTLTKAKEPMDYSLPSKVKNVADSEPPLAVQRESFLPPLTGFSDSDSSFGSITCSAEDCDKIHCICESMKKTRLLNENYNQHDDEDESGVNFINNDADEKWIVMRPTRIKPRDNLRLEGPMDMETTFQSTYETTAQRVSKNRLDSQQSKRSTGSNRPIYLNSVMGRTGATPVLRSGRKRRPTYQRPMTSLKSGGDGYYNTNNREAYKNFVIVNGEAKTVSEWVKLPKVVSKTELVSSEKNRRKYAKVAKSRAKSEEEEGEKGAKMVMIDGEEIRKFEKKSYITKSDGGEELTDVERKMIRKVKCQPKKETKETEKDDEEEIKEAKVEEPPLEQPSSQPVRPFNTQDVDNIKDLGILERNYRPEEVEQQSALRPLVRRLHETSKDFCVIRDNPPHVEPRVKPSKKFVEPIPTNPEVEPKAMVVNGHAVMGASSRPFIMPQRIQRHKNQCSVNVFEGSMDFTTTNSSSYGTSYHRNRIHSAQRKRAAGRRYLRSSKRRNLFRQSSDSIFTKPEEEKVENKPNESTYESQFNDRLYCPALDMASTAKEKFQFTGEAGGHRYYLPSSK